MNDPCGARCPNLPRAQKAHVSLPQPESAALTQFGHALALVIPTIRVSNNKLNYSTLNRTLAQLIAQK
jgi:hypothetical protein